MTAYLQPGDKIHLAIPVGILSGDDATALGQRVNDQLLPMYANLGVHIAFWTTHGGQGSPTVAAVFREPRRDLQADVIADMRADLKRVERELQGKAER